MRGDQRLDLRPELLQVGLALGQIGLARARAASVRRALGARAMFIPRRPASSPCARPFPNAARDDEGAHAEDRRK